MCCRDALPNIRLALHKLSVYAICDGVIACLRLGSRIDARAPLCSKSESMALGRIVPDTLLFRGARRWRDDHQILPAVRIIRTRILNAPFSHASRRVELVLGDFGETKSTIVLSRTSYCFVRNRSAVRSLTCSTPNISFARRSKCDDSKDEQRRKKTPQESQFKAITTQLRSIPNMITMSRIISTPYLSYLIVTERYEYAVGGCVLFALSDWLDGAVARNFEGQKTVLGTYLDPLADKIAINTIALSLWYTGILPGPLVGVWLGRDVPLIVFSYLTVQRATKAGDAVVNPATTSFKVRPSFIGKANTALQFVTLSASMTQTIMCHSSDIVLGLCWISGAMTIFSGLDYVGGQSMVGSGNKRD